MPKSLMLCLSLALSVPAFAQQETYDLVSFTPPKGWKKTSLENTLSIATTNEVDRTWAQIAIVKSTASKGSMDGDFSSEWQELAVKPYGVATTASSIRKAMRDGYQYWSGQGNFRFNNETANLTLHAFSDNTRCLSIIIMSNTTVYEAMIVQFLNSIKLSPPTIVTNSPAQTEAPGTVAVANPPGNSSPPVRDNFVFKTTNFDDGWVSVAKEDWVESTKGNLRVLLHYPRKEDADYISQQVDKTRLFWNLLVAPRYQSATDFFLYEYNNAFEPGSFAAGTLTDFNGKQQYVALFSKGKSGWIEVITPDRATFVNNFGVDRPDSNFDDWDRLFNLSGLNKFAVAAEDLQGKWTSDFSSSMQYYSVYTGLYAGYNAFTSRETFTFGNNQSYQWKLLMANTSNGVSQAQTAEATGTFSMKGNWQVVFSKIENKVKTCNAYFSCIKGGRILWLQDVAYGSYEAFGKAKE